ncbi:shiftless antiviral inhibitor of ribosomal frameshifting protein homolog [Mercenaria mercenaria]|uniref:shiftless antiviral inhibitor of ribosomal frameshifting protein homolog n=1 Tax=Mercenaria mercenaria TaxID=6596 RepID=UPI001E1D6F87|nr:shiftless antiviral inhibitor of ribosomal frameshifting protein homolog [Mercenaria mercenaria]
MAAAADNIGDGAGADLSADDWEKIKKVRKLRELWHGRFTNRNLTTLLKHHDWDENATNLFVLDALPGELRDVLGEDDWQVVENVRRNNVLRDLARLNRIGHEVRQYGCKQDDNMWWRRVPSRKPVSKCKRCKQKYEPIPREQEWGWARFECVCGHKFNAFAMMDRSLLGPRYTGKSQSLCYRCMSQLCEPIQILPPMKPKKNEREGGDGQRRRPRKYTHRCTAPNCFNRYMPDPRSNEPLIAVCVHPNSLKDKVHGFGSDRHVSTGSTVNTFLSQDDIESSYEPSLADIAEIDIDDGDNV